MIVTKLAVVAGIGLLGVFCWLAVAGFTALGIVLITATVLLVMVAGGNWLSARSGGPPTGRGASPPRGTGSRSGQ